MAVVLVAAAVLTYPLQVVAIEEVVEVLVLVENVAVIEVLVVACASVICLLAKKYKISHICRCDL